LLILVDAHAHQSTGRPLGAEDDAAPDQRVHIASWLRVLDRRALLCREQVGLVTLRACRRPCHAARLTEDQRLLADDWHPVEGEHARAVTDQKVDGNLGRVARELCAAVADQEHLRVVDPRLARALQEAPRHSEALATIDSQEEYRRTSCEKPTRSSSFCHFIERNARASTGLPRMNV